MCASKIGSSAAARTPGTPRTRRSARVFSMGHCSRARDALPVRYMVSMANTARVVVVTGGSGALGQAITQRFLGEGAVVCIPWVVDKERERLEKSVDEATRRRLHLERCDVADDAAMERFVAGIVAMHGSLDVLVGAVGGFAMGELVQTDRAQWDAMLTLNLTTQYVAARAVLPHMLTAGSGRIVSVASRAVLTPTGGLIA